MKKAWVLLLLPAACILQFCSPSKKSTTPAAKIINFEMDVLPVVTAKCSPCHAEGGKKSKITDYAIAKGEIDDIITRISKNPGEHGFMPMRGQKLSEAEINAFVQWKASGLLEK